MKNVCVSVLFLFLFILNCKGQAPAVETILKATSEGIAEKWGTEGFIKMATKNIGKNLPVVVSGSGINSGLNLISISNNETSQKGNVLSERLTNNPVKINLDIVESFTQKVGSIKGFTNDDVKEAQKALNALTNAKLAVDGKFGIESVKALNTFNHSGKAKQLREEINSEGVRFKEDGIHKSQIYERLGNEGPTGLPDLSIQKSVWSLGSSGFLETVTAPSLNAEELGKR